MIASTVAKGKENGKRTDNESTTTTIISLSRQMAHKHSRRVRRRGRRRIRRATSRVNQPNRSMIYKKGEEEEEVTSRENESSCNSRGSDSDIKKRKKCYRHLPQLRHLAKQVEAISRYVHQIVNRFVLPRNKTSPLPVQRLINPGCIRKSSHQFPHQNQLLSPSGKPTLRITRNLVKALPSLSLRSVIEARRSEKRFSLSSP